MHRKGGAIRLKNERAIFRDADDHPASAVRKPCLPPNAEHMAAIASRMATAVIVVNSVGESCTHVHGIVNVK